jgi:hypothetical protein
MHRDDCDMFLYQNGNFCALMISLKVAKRSQNMYEGTL